MNIKTLNATLKVILNKEIKKNRYKTITAVYDLVNFQAFNSI